MVEHSDRKLYLGPRLRVLRRNLGINQARMAEELGISPSYLNHLERNQRPLTAQMLVRLASTYDLDVRDFVAGAGEAANGNLHEIFADLLVRDIAIPRHEVLEVAENYPGVSEAITRLYGALIDLRTMPDALDRMETAGVAMSSPIEWLRDYLQQRRNHLPELDSATEALAADLPADPVDLYGAMQGQLGERFSIAVRVMPEAALAGVLRHYDLHRRRLMLSERLRFPSRLFALAYQLCLAALDAPIEDAIGSAAPPDGQTRDLLKVALTNYAAAALVMPYERFRLAAEESRYDLPLLEARFGASFEQVAHRLTSLGRSGARGIPFFMLKVDSAGIISKRFAGDSFPFARFGGACPRWKIHQAFGTPGEIVTEIVETPDGQRYFTIARAMPRDSKPDSKSQVAIGLGCEVKHAARIVHADRHDLEQPQVTAIGPTCHICERIACPDRSLPPVTRSLEMHPLQKSASPYPFRRV
jgi:predicted transcriptional regulator/DNA-binding XRE family transcriptional regulator